MGSEVEIVEERLKSFLDQLQTEFGILDRIVYKNKNQHRRSLYFQYLLKVRRDLKLLQLAHLEEIVNSSFLVINGKRPKQKVQLLESLKRKRCDGAKLNFLERLLGVARLLSQMVEPMLKAATDISTLLAQSFFMGFSLTTLALLARLRVLVQQILLDVVSVFNMVSSLSQKEQSVKITQEGFEVFREYYPKNEEAISLECVWEKDKFVLVEKMDKIEIRNQEMDTEIDVPTASSSQIQYQSIEAWLGDAAADDDKSGDMNPKNSVEVCDPPPENVLNSTISQDSNPLKRKSLSREKVAFLSVKRPASSVAKDSGLKLERTEPASSVAKDSGLKLERTENSDDKKDDPFFSLLTSGNPKGSLF